MAFNSKAIPAPLRIGALDLPVPYVPRLKHEFRATEEKIIDRIAPWMG